MKIRFSAVALVLALIFTLSGCSEVAGEIAGNVANAAVQELEKQVKETLEEYKVEVIEVKSAVGKLNNDSDSELQFYCGVLVRSNSDVFPQSGAAALGKIFDESGVHLQTEREIDSDFLVNKDISFNHTDFSTGNYYLIWAYTASFTENLSEKLSTLELPTIPADWIPAGGARETEAGSVG